MSTFWGLGDLPNASSRGNLFMSVLCETMIIAGRFWYLFGCILEPFLSTFWGPGDFPTASSRENWFSIDFDSILDLPSWEPCWAKMDPLNFAKLLFSTFYPLLGAFIIQPSFGKACGPSRGSFGTVLGLILGGFSKPKWVPTSTSTLMPELCFRWGENQILKVRSASKNIKNRRQNGLPNMLTRSSQKLSKSVPKLCSEGSKRLPKGCQNLPSTRRTENFEGQRRHGWKQWKKQRKKRGGAIPTPPSSPLFSLPVGREKGRGVCKQLGIQTTENISHAFMTPEGSAD